MHEMGRCRHQSPAIVHKPVRRRIRRGRRERTGDRQSERGGGGGGGRRGSEGEGERHTVETIEDERIQSEKEEERNLMVCARSFGQLPKQHTKSTHS